MITISLCMIVRNEEKVLPRCLQSVQGIPDEIIIVDTGSTDQTIEIAKAYGAKVYEQPWTDDFSKARNASFGHATMEYLLWLDADDIMDDENRGAFVRLKQSLCPTVDVVMMPYHVAFDEGGKPTYTFFRERLLKRAQGFRWEGRVHEAIVTFGNVQKADIAIRHEKPPDAVSPGRNLRIYEKMIAEGEALPPRHQYYYARELLANHRLSEAANLLRRCVHDPEAWVENRIGACRDLSACMLSLGKPDDALEALFLSLPFGEPRAEICCDIGSIFLSKNKIQAAIFWYRAAPTCTPSEMDGGFALPECRGYIPYMQLCLCYDRIGQHRIAEEYNEKAAALKPSDAAVLTNRAYFKALRRRQAEARQ